MATHQRNPTFIELPEVDADEAVAPPLISHKMRLGAKRIYDVITETMPEATRIPFMLALVELMQAYLGRHGHQT